MSQNGEGGLHRRLTLNSFSNLSRYVLSIGIAFFLTPFIVRNLGDSQYGFWILLLSFIGYASILEMGVQPAVVKLVGQYKGVGQYDKLRELVTAAFGFFLLAGLLVGVLCLTVVPHVVERYVEDLRGVSRTSYLFWAIGADSLVMYMNYLFTGILYGWQRYHLRNLIDVGGWILNATLVVIFLPEHGLVALVSSKLAMDTAILLASIVATRRLFPGFRFDLRSVGRDSYRELMGFGGRVFLSATTTRVATHAQPIIISTALSSAATTFYAIPLKLVDYTRQVAWALTAGFMPMFSELESRQERAALRRIYLTYTRYIFMALLPMSLLLLVYGAPFIGLWIGPEYAERGRVVILLLTVSSMVESFQPLLWRFFIGVGHLNVLVRVSATVSPLTVVASIALVQVFGIAGVALSVLAGTTVSQITFALHACRYLEISPLTLFAQIHMRSLVAGALTFGVAELLNLTLGHDSYPTLVAGVAASATAYVVLALAIGLSGRERRAVIDRLRNWARSGGRPATEEGR